MEHKTVKQRIKAESAGTPLERGRGGRGKGRRKINLALLQAVSEIVEMGLEEGLRGDFFTNAKKQLKMVAGEYGLSWIQAGLFAQFLFRYDDSGIWLGQIADAIRCTKLEMIQYEDDIDFLEKRRLLTAARDEEPVRYSVHPEVIRALREGQKYRPSRDTNLSADDFFQRLEDLYERQGYVKLSQAGKIAEFKELVAGNMHLRFCRALRDFQLSDTDAWVLGWFCRYHNRGNDFIFLPPLQREFFDKQAVFVRLYKSFLDNTGTLVQKGLVARCGEDDDEGNPRFRLTGQALQALFREKAEDAFLLGGDAFIRHRAIPEKPLFYAPSCDAQVRRLSRLLEEEGWKTVQERLKDHGMRTGFACLFSGGPGTGKTETALQLARRCGRDIMKVEIAAVYDPYVGETEGNIKQIFDVYREAAKNARRAPILLINEADGIIGKRLNIGEQQANQTIAQMENRIQNIILDEMDRLPGILIATTNMTVNMDKAFERRFIFKIEFPLPGPEVREKLWRTMLEKELSPEDARSLALRFALSGGQIENAARKYLVEAALSGASPGLETLAAFCREELQKKEAPIGFLAGAGR